MRINRRIAAVVATTALIAGASTIAGAAADLDPPANVTGCLKANGTIVAVAQGATPQRACVAPETKVTLSNGDITSVRGKLEGGITVSGSTILSGNVDKSGEVELGISDSFRLPQLCTGGQIPMRAASTSGWACANPLPAKRIVQGRAWGPGRIAEEWSQLGKSLRLQPGVWLIEARAHFTPHDGSSSVYADCRLGVGNAPAVDAATVGLHYEGELSLTTVANALDPFNVSMSCENWGAGDTDWYDMTITATPADQAQTVGL